MAWVAVSEATTAHGKQQSITRITRTVTTVAMLSGGAAIAAPPAPNQLPTGGQVAAGIAAIGTNGNTMTVTQTSDRAAINWNTFDIGSQAQVNFVQPSSQAVALNRVNSPNPSQIYGQLSSNGQVYLINAAGVYFAPGAQVNVGGIVATTMQMSDAAFMAGSTTFDRNGSTGKVINDGTIQTSLNGYIAMLAPEVRNSGLLLAQSGTVALAAGERITLNFGPTSKLDSITVTEAQLDTLVENRYAIKAPNGLVILSARAANQLAASVVNSGTIEAKGASQQGGRILLEGSTVTNTGTLDVSSDTAQAGTIQINGKNVSISGNVVATSTTRGPGSQGGAIKVSATQSLNVNNANINASTANGTGGQIELTAHQLTVADSSLSADGDTGGTVQITATASQPNNPFHDPLNIPTLPATLAATGFTSISSRGRRGQGGNVTLTGDDITLDGSTNINVSGSTGGGNALIGGDWQGSNGVYQATTVLMTQNVSIDASATYNGNGGKVVLWSDIHNANSWTNVYGSIYAKGGAKGGDGGKIETSGRAMALAGAMIDAGSVAGKAGLWLIDPYDYNIDSSAASTISSSLNSTDVLVTTSSSGGTGVVGSGSGNITISGNINKTSGAATTLTLVADNWIGGTGNIYSSGNKLSTIFNTGANQGIYSGYIYGNVSVTKLGAGTLSLTYANAYTGGTELSAGTLGIYNNSALGTGLLTAGNNTNVLFGRSVSNVVNNISLTGAVTFAFDRNVEFLLVGGGAGGGGGAISSGWPYGGGGGGGGAGQLTSASYQISSGSNSVVVGSGGNGGDYGRDGGGWNGTNGTSGGTSSFYGYSAAGGAYGVGAGVNTSSQNGGAGGTSGANLAGGTSAGGGGGGGGATTVGSNAAGGTGGTGGAGATSLLTGLLTTYGVGGNGGSILQPDGANGANGSANTGSGGSGGGGSRWYAGTGGAGGSGLVVIRYIGGAAGSGGTVSSGSGAATGYTLHSFTTVGTDTLTLSPLAVTLSGNISGAGSAIMNAGGGTMTMSGANTYTGSTNVTGGTLVVSGGLSSSTAVNVGGGAYFNIARTNTVASIVGSGTINLGNGYTLTAGDDNNSTTFSGVISGAGSLAKSGTGTLTLTNSETYTGSTNVTAGTLVVTGYLSDSTAVNVTSGASYSVLSNDTVASIAGGGTINLGSGYTLTSGSGGSTTFSGVIAGAGGLTKAGAGTTLMLTGSNTYSGTTTVSAGSLMVGNGTANGSVNVSSNIAIGSGATLVLNRSDALTFANNISGAGGVTISQANAVNLTGAATYTGNTTVGGGALTFTNTNVPSTSNIMGTGTVLIQPASTSFGSAQTFSANVTNGITSLTIGTSNNTANLTITGNVNVSGPITLYGGNVSVNATLTSTATAEHLIKATAGNIILNAGFNQTAGANSTLTLQATNNVTQAAGANIIGSGNSTLSVVAWGNSNGSNPTATVSLGNITTNNGSLWAGGGNGTAGWTTVSPALVVGSTGANLTLNGNIAVGNGTALLYQKSGTALNIAAANLSITADANGSVVLISDTFGSNALTINDDGFLTFLSNSPNANFGGQFNWNGTVSGSVLTGSGSLANIKIAHWANNISAGGGYLKGIKIGVDNITPYNLYNNGSTAGNITINADMLLPGFIDIAGKDITINGNIGTAVTSPWDSLIKSDQGNVTQGAGSTLYSSFRFFGGNVSLNNANNQISTLQATDVGDFSVVNSYNTSLALTLNGVSASGNVSIQNQGGMLVNGSITTTSTANASGAPALLLAAGYNQAVGSTVYNVSLNGTPSISVDNSGLGVIYTGSTNNANLTTVVGNGSGHFRYNTNISSAGYNVTAAPLTTNASTSTIYALYREQPTLTVTAANSTSVYGQAVPSPTFTSTSANGDTIDQIFGVGAGPNVTLLANTSTAGFVVAGNATLVASGPSTNDLGYAAPTYVNGTATVTRANLTVAGTVVANKEYDGNTNATFTSLGSLVGVLVNGTSNVSDVVTLTTSGSFSSKNVGNNIALTMSDSITGTDADNYNIIQPTVTANITPKIVSLSAAQDYSGSTTLTNVTIVTGIAGETLTYTGATANSSHVADNSTNYITAITLGDQAGATASSGVLASNYQLPTTLNHTSAPVTISAAPVTLTATGAISKVYSANTSATVGAGNFTVGGLVSGDSLTLGNLSTAAFNNANVLGANSVSVSNLTLASISGNHSSATTDYDLQTTSLTWGNGGPGGTSASITVAPLGIEAAGTYSGSTTVTPSSYTLTGLQGSDTITGIVSLTVNNANVAATTNGTQYITGIGATNGTANLNNYQLNGSRNATTGTNTTNVFTMARANLTVTPDNDALFIGEALPNNANYTVRYGGLVGGQTAASLITASTLTAGTVTNSAGSAGNTTVPAGSYNLTASGWSADNYAISYANGTFTVSPADALIVQVGSQSMTYGTSLTTTNGLYGTPTVRYLANGSSSVVTLTQNANQSSGNHYVYDDGMGGGVAFNLTVSNGSYSTSNNLVAGNGYQLTSANIAVTGNNLNLTNGTTTTGAMAVNAMNVTASTGNVSKVYDGSTSMQGLSITLTPAAIAGDEVSTGGAGAFSQANVGTNLSYNVTGLALTGADAANYVLSGGTSFSGSNGVITPRTVTLSANQTYSGSTTLTNVTIGNLVGTETLTYSAGTANSKNVQDNGTNYITGLTLGNGTNGGLSSNYQLPTLNHTNAPVTINRLSSVTWTGGSSGNWFDPANWAGGAVPDLNNVANVVIPNGVTVSFNTSAIVPPAQLGTVSIDSLGGSGGNLSQNSGTLNVGTGGISLGTLTLTGGNLSSQGTVMLTTYNQSNGTSAFSGDLLTTNYLQSGGDTTVNGNLNAQTYNQSGGSSTVLGALTTVNYLQSNGTTTVTGNLTSGNMTLTGGTTNALSNLTVSNTLDQQAGNLSVTGNTTAGNISLSGGNLTANGSLTTGNLSQSNGTLTANSSVTVNGTYNLSGGNATIAGNLTTQTYNQSGGSATVLGTFNSTNYLQSNGTTTFTGNLTSGNMTLTGGSTNALSNLVVTNTLDQQAGNLSITGNTTAGNINLSGGNLTGQGNITAGNLSQTNGTLTANSNLTVNGTYSLGGGNATIAGNLQTQTYNQSGGSATILGTFNSSNYIQSNGTTTVTGNLTTTNMTQSGGNTTTLGSFNVNGSYNQTGGRVNVTGSANITTVSTMTLGNLTVGGALNAHSTGGSINQTAGTQMSVTGRASFYAPNGVISLNPNNSFPGGNSIIDHNGDRNKPAYTGDPWIFQQTMVQGGTVLYIPLPKTQVGESRKTHTALAFTGDVILLADEAPEKGTDPGFMATPEAGFTDRFFDTAPRMTLLPTVHTAKVVQHGDRLLIVDTDGPRLKPVGEEGLTLPKPGLQLSTPDDATPGAPEKISYLD